jgi:hypothetical protein
MILRSVLPPFGSLKYRDHFELCFLCEFYGKFNPSVEIQGLNSGMSYNSDALGAENL